MADGSYAAAEGRAREARRAGLQARKDEQPANTARSYAAKQREWRTWCSTPRAAPDGTLYTWPDGELVTPDKLAAWLKEDILLRRVKVPKPKKKKQASAEQPAPIPPAEERAALQEAEELATVLDIPVADAIQALANDRESYVPPTTYAAPDEPQEGQLLTKGTVDAYIAAVIELWGV